MNWALVRVVRTAGKEGGSPREQSRGQRNIASAERPCERPAVGLGNVTHQ
jgi:hypothetical protein